MKTIITSAAVAAALLLGTAASAQTSHYSTLEGVRESLIFQCKESGYKVEMTDDGIRLFDASHKRELVSLRQISDETILVSGTVAYIDMRESLWKEQVRQKIGDLNVSSPVGTLSLDDKHGSVVMQHYLSAQSLSTAIIAKVAMVFVDTEQHYAHDFQQLELTATK